MATTGGPADKGLNAGATGPAVPPLASMSMAMLGGGRAASALVRPGSAATAVMPPPTAAASGRVAAIRSHAVVMEAEAAAGPQQAAVARRQPGRRLQRLLGSLLGGGRAPRRASSTPPRAIMPPMQAFAARPGALLGMRVFPSTAQRRIHNGHSNGPAAAAGRRAAVVWFRNDLRLHDNQALASANAEGTSVLPVYIFDPRDYGKSASGFDKTGPYRAQFLLDSVAELRRRLRAAGSELVVRLGRPEEVLPDLLRRCQAGALYCQAEVTAEDAQVEAHVRAAVEKEGAEYRAAWGGTLYHPDDLPFRLDSMPTNYSDFRAKVAGVAVRQVAADCEQQLKALPLGRVEPGSIPSLKQLGLGAPAKGRARGGGSRSGAASGNGAPLGSDLRGGEAEALKHLQAFLAELKSTLAAAQQQAGRGGSSTTSAGAAATSPAISSHFSCRISPWLAAGCLSPRYMYQQMQQQLGAAAMGRLGPGSAAADGVQAPRGGAAAAAGSGSGPGPASTAATANGANWLVFELLWRDFFRFVTKKYADANATVNAGTRARPALAMAS